MTAALSETGRAYDGNSTAEESAYREAKRYAEKSIGGLNAEGLAAALDFQISQALSEAGHMSPVDLEHRIRPVRIGVIDAMKRGSCSSDRNIDRSNLEISARHGAEAGLEDQTGQPADIGDVARITVTAIQLTIETSPMLCSQRGLQDLFVE